jgi:hypothetical protein
VDKVRFPLLAGGTEFPCRDLMGCQGLTFFSPEKPAEVTPIILKQGTEWHLYGDTRWPSLSSWVEFNMSPMFPGWAGVLVVAFEIPEDEADPFSWAAHEGPLSYLFPEERGVAATTERLEKLRQQSTSAEKIPEPSDVRPRYVQNYCIYRGPGKVEPIARYTDLLNAGGIPITRYRIASIHPRNIDVCRFALHSLYRLNAARLDGMDFLEEPQLDVCEPCYLLPDQKSPPWARFHPSRVLRTRPAIRALPNPTNMHEGIMQMETMQHLMETRRLEQTLHMLAFEAETRPRTIQNEDVNATTGAFVHRANGGAIYVLPDQLVDEFDNTDCDEIQLKDIKLPFPNLFVKFTPPKPLFLAEGAPVDGCYIAKQGEEYLFSLTSQLEGVDYERSVSVACVDTTFSLHLLAPELKLDKPDEHTDIRINESVELGIKDFLERNAPPTDNISQTITRPDGTTAHVEDVRANSRKRRIEIFRSQEPVFRACLNIIVNAACFISFWPEDITEEWDGDLPAWIEEALNDTKGGRSARDRKRHAHSILSKGDYTRIRICGKNLFQEPTDPTSTGHGQSPRAHWRRGHWRRQRHGAGLTLMTPRWIRPTIVKKDNGPIVESRIYDVQQPPSE